MTYLLLDTSTPTCRMTVVTADGTRHVHDWQADRQLARELLAHLRDALDEAGTDMAHLAGIGVYPGPGSFTGLRIGLTVAGTIAASAGVPIVGETGDSWQETALARLTQGDDDRIVMPYYGRDARITTQKK